MNFTPFRIAVVVALVLLVYSVAYLLFPNPLGDDPSRYGTFGDFLGGMLNPLLSFASFMAILYTLGVQRSEAKSAEAARREDHEVALDQLRQMRREAELNEITRLITVIEADLDRILSSRCVLPAFSWTVEHRESFYEFLAMVNFNHLRTASVIGQEIRKSSSMSKFFVWTGDTLSVINDHLIAYAIVKPDQRFLRHYRDKYIAVTRAMLFLGFIEREDVSVLLSNDDLSDEPLYPVYGWSVADEE